MKKLLFFIGTTMCALQVFAQSPSFISDSLPAYIEKGLADWQVPGLAIVIVKDGKIVHLKGYGVANITTRAAVNENTLFFIASNTKLFTGTALAQLEYRKKISLNDKISKYYPDYKLYEKTSSDIVTIKDMLSHRIGTKTFQGDFTFWNSKLSRAEIMNRMRLLKPINTFRQEYGYCNSCFLTAGQIIPKVTGKEWEDYIRDSIIKPLEMNNSYTSSNNIQKKVSNIATPYSTSFSNKLNEVPYDMWDNIGPAASVVSNVNDLSHWLMFQLDSGRYNGKRIMPFDILQKTRDLNIITSSRKSSLYPVHIRGYGLGLFGCDYNGRQIYWHTGGAAGMVSNVCFVPEEKLGIAILTNNDNQNFFECLRYQILDAYLNVPYVNRSMQQLNGFNEGMQEQLKEVDGWNKRINAAQPDFAAYAGSYVHPLYGSMDITAKGDKLVLKFNSHENLTATMQQMDKDEWLLKYDNIEYGIFATQFKMQKGKVVSVDIKANDFVEYDGYTFTKK
jgi:CubicO group peptidase (beta-lactamase class C family)